LCTSSSRTHARPPLTQTQAPIPTWMDTRTWKVVVWLGFHFSLSWLACQVLMSERHTLPSAYKFGLKRARPRMHAVHAHFFDKLLSWLACQVLMSERHTLPSAYKFGLKRARPCMHAVHAHLFNGLPIACVHFKQSLARVPLHKERQSWAHY